MDFHLLGKENSYLGYWFNPELTDKIKDAHLNLNSREAMKSLKCKSVLKYLFTLLLLGYLLFLFLGQWEVILIK